MTEEREFCEGGLVSASPLKIPNRSGDVIVPHYAPLMLSYKHEDGSRNWSLTFWGRPERHIELTGDTPTRDELIVTLGHSYGLTPAALAEVLLTALHAIGKVK